MPLAVRISGLVVMAVGLLGRLPAAPVTLAVILTVRREGLRLGGGTINLDGTWSGQWQTGPVADAAGHLVIPVAAASAVVVKVPLP